MFETINGRSENQIGFVVVFKIYNQIWFGGRDYDLHLVIQIHLVLVVIKPILIHFI